MLRYQLSYLLEGFDINYRLITKFETDVYYITEAGTLEIIFELLLDYPNSRYTIIDGITLEENNSHCSEIFLNELEEILENYF